MEMNDLAEEFMIGATTIGLVCKDGTILSSEKRVSYGHMIMSKSGKKTFPLTDYVGAACAGLIADMQILIRQVAAYAKLYELDNGRRISVRSKGFLTNKNGRQILLRSTETGPRSGLAGSGFKGLIALYPWRGSFP